MKVKSTVLFIACSLILTNLQGQGILNRVLKRSLNKAENKVEDMLVEKASDAIAERLYRSMSDAFDKMLDDAAKQDSAYQTDYSDSAAIKYNRLAEGWLERMNKAADVPESYAFDYKAYVEITSNGDPQNSILYLTSDGSVFAMEQLEEKEKRICLIDGAKDVVVLYMEDQKGNKTAQAIPNMMGLGAQLAQNMADSTVGDWSFKATGKSKTIAGYPSDEYISTDGKYENTFYMTDDLDISWRNAFSGFVDRFAGTTYKDLQQFPQGFLMESHTKKAGKSKEESSWITNKVEKEQFTIQNAEYEFGNLSTTD